MAPIHITWNGTGKMEGMTSINDDPYSNRYCTTQCKNRLSCYAKHFCRLFPNNSKAFKPNGDLMSFRYLDDWEIPRFAPGQCVRVHSYGELRNVQHMLNINLIAWVNPDTKFTMWTHRPEIVEEAAKQARLQPNLRLIWSAPVDNLEADVPDRFVGTFVPVRKATALRDGVPMFCHGQRCIDCMHCYTKPFVGTIYAPFKPYKRRSPRK